MLKVEIGNIQPINSESNCRVDLLATSTNDRTCRSQLFRWHMSDVRVYPVWAKDIGPFGLKQILNKRIIYNRYFLHCYKL